MAWRAARHHLTERVTRGRMLEVVADLAGIHAQLMSSAELTLWARVDGLAPDAVQRALWEERSVVKSWAMRGTLHLLPAAEYPLWQAGFSTYRHYLRPVWFRNFGITPGELEQLMAGIAEALDGRLLTRQELGEEVTRLTGSSDLGEKVQDSWGPLLKPASFRGHLCFAPNDGRNVRFTRPDRWLRDWRGQDPDDAMLQITRRFLAAHGPATREDYARWWAMTPAAAGALLERLGDEATPVEVDGTAAWMLTAHAGEIEAAVPSRAVHLLPAFDQYVIAATRHARGLLPGDFADRIYRAQGWLSPVILVAGRMDGIWRHERKGGRLLVTIEPFVPLPGWARRAAEDEAERLATYLAAGLRLAWAGSP